jgi:hypothetical protein
VFDDKENCHQEDNKKRAFEDAEFSQPDVAEMDDDDSWLRRNDSFVPMSGVTQLRYEAQDTSHPTSSNRSSFTSLPRDLGDDARCTTRRRSFTSFEAKLGNPIPTCFTMKQATGCQRVFSHRLHPLIGFEVRIDKPPPTLF